MTINGGVTVDAGWFDGNATQNFWRSTENLSVEPPGGTNQWAVSQAAPFRRMHIKGALNLAPTGYGWASGGYIADTKVDGADGSVLAAAVVHPRQPVGAGSAACGTWCSPACRALPPTTSRTRPTPRSATTPVTREKPYLYVDAGGYRVFVPSLRTNAAAPSWANGSTPGTSLPMQPVLRRQAGRHGRDHQRRARPGPEPVLHPRHLQPQPDRSK